MRNMFNFRVNLHRFITRCVCFTHRDLHALFLQARRRAESFEDQLGLVRAEMTRLKKQSVFEGNHAVSTAEGSALTVAVDNNDARVEEIERELREARAIIDRMKACEANVANIHALDMAKTMKELETLRSTLTTIQNGTAAQIEHTANTVLRAKPRRSAMNMLSDVKKMFEHLCNKLLHEEVDAEDFLMSNARRNKALVGTTVFKQFLPEIPNATTPVWFEGVVESYSLRLGLCPLR